MSVACEKSFGVARLPSWFKQEIPDGNQIREIKNLVGSKNLHTVCEDARCPNSGKCWQQGVVTVMILGNVCTRSCRFCAVGHGKPLDVDAQEPQNVAALIQKLNLQYVVITSVTRDDLADGGAEQFVRTICAVRETMPQVKMEVLIPDFGGNRKSLAKVVAAQPDVIGHNMEMVARLFPVIRPQADYSQSLNVLRAVKELDPQAVVKSGFMVGLGETDSEIEVLLKDLATADADIVTIGQYLSPSSGQARVARFVEPQKFIAYKESGEQQGLKFVMSGPLVRSSYLAHQGYQEFLRKKKGLS